MTSGPSYGHYLLRTDRLPGGEPLPYVKTGRQTFIASLVLIFHAALIVVPMVFLAVSEWIKPPVYVMRLPTVDSVPNENPEMSPHPSPLNRKSTGVPEKGKPISEIPQIPDLVQPIDPPPKPQPPKPEPVVKEIPKKPPVKASDPVRPKPMPESSKRTPAEVKPKPQPKNTLLTADQIKVSRKRVRNPNQTAADKRAQAAEQARAARNAEMARTLRSLTGEIGGKGTPGGGGGRKGIVSKEISDYYSKVEVFLKRRWEQPSIYGNDSPRVIILFRVNADGRIAFARIQERSGIAVMDASVEQLLRNLQTLPVPPQPMEFTVTMEIDR